MKIAIFSYLFSVFLFLSPMFGQVETNLSKQVITESEPSEKMIFGEVGWGARNLSLALGFRWEFLSASIALSGFSTEMPKGIYPRPPQYPPPNEYIEEQHPSITVCFDLCGYLDYDDFSFYIDLGYYSQTDSVFKKSLDQNTAGIFFIDPIGNRAAKIQNGICFGGGFQYFASEYIVLGLGWHNKKGIFAQIGYYFY